MPVATIELSMTREQTIRQVLEREGVGPSTWGSRDCITLVRAFIRELSGREPVFDRPNWAIDMTEREAILEAPIESGTLAACLTTLLDSDPMLRRATLLLKPGMIVLDGRGWLGVVGPEYEIWRRIATGLERVVEKPVRAWAISCHS